MENENKWEYDYSSANSSSGDAGYPNVGSSGMNTANTAGTYSDPAPARPSETSTGNGGTTPPPAGPEPQAAASKPPKKRRKHSGSRIARSAAALVLAAAMGFAGGFVGARVGNAGNKVVIQSAFGIAEPKQAQIEEALKKQITNGFTIRYLREPDIVSGIELRVNGNKIAWSLNEYLETLVESLTETLQREAHAA